MTLPAGAHPSAFWESRDAEIKRLRAAIAESCDEQRYETLGACERATKAGAEIKRLRAALQQIADGAAGDVPSRFARYTLEQQAPEERGHLETPTGKVG